MLTQLRKHSKGFLAVFLFGMLILSFAVWGIGDIFRGHSDSFVVRVGDRKVGVQEFRIEAQRELRRLAPMMGGTIDAEKARQMGLYDRIADGIVTRLLFEEAARREGIMISDSLVRDTIRNDVAFRDAAGGFDQRRYEQFLYNNQLTEGQFVALLRARMSRDQLASAIAAGVVAPDAMLRPLFAYRMERRNAEVVAIPRSAFGAPEPDAAAIEAYYKDHERSFMAPEYRAINYVTMSAEELAKTIAIGDDKLREEYEARKADFEVPETREVEQFILDNKESAERAEALLKQGKDFAQVSKDTAKIAPITLGAVSKPMLESQSPELANAVFGLAQPGVTAPVETPFGWHILRVSKIVPGRRVPFEQVRADLAKFIAREQAVDQLYQIVNKFEDDLAAGTSLDDAATKYGLKAVKVASVDAAGRDAKGQAIADLPKSPEFLRTAFATDVGRDSRLVEYGNDGYFVIHVDGSTPPAVRPLDQVRAQVVEAWKNEKRDEAAKARAQAIVERVRGGADLAGIVAGEKGLRVMLPAPFTREAAEPAQGLTPQLSALLFEAKKGDVVMAPSPDGYVVGKLRDIHPGDPTADPKAYDQARLNMRNAVASDMLYAYVSSLRSRLKVEVNRTAFDSAMAP